MVLVVSWHGDILQMMMHLLLLLLLRIEPCAVDLHVQVVLHVTLTTAITDPVLMMKRGVVCCIVRAATSRRHRRTLLSVLVPETAAARRSNQLMPAQVI